MATRLFVGIGMPSNIMRNQTGKLMFGFVASVTAGPPWTVRLWKNTVFAAVMPTMKKVESGVLSLRSISPALAPYFGPVTPVTWTSMVPLGASTSAPPGVPLVDIEELVRAGSACEAS